MFIRYPDAFVCRVTGKHAAQYLQNRLSNDVRSLRPGSGACEAAALSPQGRILAVFNVAALAADSFLLVADGGPRGEVLQALSQFKVAERVEFSDESDSYGLLHCAGLSPENLKNAFPELANPPAAQSFCEAAGCYLISVPRFTEAGVHAVVPVEKMRETVAALQRCSRELTGEALTLARISKNVAGFPEELNSELLLSESGRTNLVSFTKGCYVGQEVVAKIDAIGRAPRVLVRFRSSSEQGPQPGAPITAAGDAGGRVVGKVLTTVHDPAEGAVLGFAILKNDKSVLSGSVRTPDEELVLLR